MARSNGFWKVAAIVTAATVGDGVFALPFVFYSAGWLLSLGYMVVLGAIVVGAHVVYFQTLQKVGEKERLLGLARRYLGPIGFWVGFLAIVLGLLLTLVAYLILGSQFIRLGFPGLPAHFPLIMFWLFIAGIVLMSDARVMTLELLGIFFTAAAIVLVFATALPGIGFDGAPAINWSNAFLPFGAILFSLAGWTGIEPAYESRKGLRRAFNPWMPLLFGSVFAATLYVLFTAGVLSSVTGLTQDTISSLGSWPVWKRDIIAMLGLFAVATVAMPISREIKNALEKDLRWNAFWSRGVIVLFPIACVLAGLNNFLTVIGIVGGVFLSTQYLLIVSVARRALSLSFRKKVLLDFVAIVFAIAAIYQIITFIVR